jgi:hypothetical protein
MFFTFMMFTLAGTTDFALLLDSHVNVVYAARIGARTGAVMAQSTEADCVIVGAVQATLQNQPDVALQQIIIYKADANGLDIGRHQIYSGSDSCAPTPNTPNSFTWQVAGPLTGSNWPPGTGRSNTPFLEDSIGVKLIYMYTFRFNLIGVGPFQLTDSAVYPLDVSVVPPSQQPTICIPGGCS